MEACKYIQQDTSSHQDTKSHIKQLEKEQQHGKRYEPRNSNGRKGNKRSITKVEASRVVPLAGRSGAERVPVAGVSIEDSIPF